MPWGVIGRSPVVVDVLDTKLRRIVRVLVYRIRVRRSCDEPLFDELCRASFYVKQAANQHWRSFRTSSNWVLFRQSERESNACYTNARTGYEAIYRESLHLLLQLGISGTH